VTRNSENVWIFTPKISKSTQIFFSGEIFFWQKFLGGYHKIFFFEKKTWLPHTIFFYKNFFFHRFFFSSKIFGWQLFFGQKIKNVKFVKNTF